MSHCLTFHGCHEEFADFQSSFGKFLHAPCFFIILKRKFSFSKTICTQLEGFRQISSHFVISTIFSWNPPGNPSRVQNIAQLDLVFFGPVPEFLVQCEYFCRNSFQQFIGNHSVVFLFLHSGKNFQSLFRNT